MSDPNENRPGYKETKVGWIPNDWKCTRLTKVAELESGHTPSRDRDDYWNGGIGWVSLHDTGALDGREIQSSAQTVSAEGIKNSSARILPEGTVIFSRTATVGKSTVLGCAMATSQDFANFICGEYLHNHYLVQLFRGMATVWRSLMSGSTHKTVYMPEFKRLTIAIPPINEQLKITAVLSTCDEVIEMMGLLIAAKKRQKKALMQQLLTGKKRLPGFEGGWETQRFSEIFERVTRKNSDRCDNNLTISGSLGLINQEEYFNKRIAAKDVSGYYLIKRGELAYNKSYCNGYPLGAIKMLSRYSEGVVSTLYICFRLKKMAADSDFVRHYFESAAFNRELYKVAQEGARNHGLLNVSPEDFFNTHLVFPGVDEQVAIARVLGEADRELAALDAKMKAYKKQKKSLMKKLLTGQVRVKV